MIDTSRGTTSGRARAPRKSKTEIWQEAFLVALAETSNVTASATAAKITLSHVYKARRKDAGFARKWQAALCEGYDNLELELLYRLRSGDKEGVKYDNATSLRLLVAHRDSRVREFALRDNEDAEAIRKRIEAKLVALRDQVLARRAAEATESEK